MDTATCYQQSDPTQNRHFRRRWHHSSPPPVASRPAAAPAEDAEPGLATLVRWRDEWRARRAIRPSREEAPCPAAPRS